MNKKAFIQLPIVIGILLFLLLGAIVVAKFSEPTTDEQGNPSKAKTVTCDVTLKKHTFGKEYIANVACDTTEGCGVFDALGIFTERGHVRLIDSKKVLDRKEWKFTAIFHETHKVTLSGCTADTKVKIRLTDDEDNTIDEQTVEVK